jgi:hypothetical protein
MRAIRLLLETESQSEPFTSPASNLRLTSPTRFELAQRALNRLQTLSYDAFTGLCLSNDGDLYGTANTELDE